MHLESSWSRAARPRRARSRRDRRRLAHPCEQPAKRIADTKAEHEGDGRESGEQERGRDTYDRPPRRQREAKEAAAKNVSAPSAKRISDHWSSVSAWTVRPEASRLICWPSAS